MPTNVEVPSLGDSVREAVLIKWHKGDGEVVKADEPLCELETDKANVDLPSPASGVLRRVTTEGATVQIGETVARIDEGGASAGNGAAVAKAPAAPAVEAKPAAAPEAKADELSPAVRRLVEENKLNPAEIPATGPGNRITKEDVLKFIEAKPAAAPAAPEVDAPPPVKPPTNLPPMPAAPPKSESAAVAPKAKPPTPSMAFDPDGTKRVPMSKMRKKIAERLVQAQQTAAILTTFNEVDLTEILAIRAKYKDKFAEKYGVGLGLMSFFARATVLALNEYPRVNAEMSGDDILYHQYVNLGIAVSTDRGLAVPVLRNAEQMSFAKIESEIKRLATATRDGKLGLNELSGGTFTITNGGVFGSLLSTPIINTPQSGILGMHTIQKRPMVVGDEVKIRSMMYTALSYDHRMVDGKESVSFLVRLKELLEDPTRLMLEI